MFKILSIFLIIGLYQNCAAATEGKVLGLPLAEELNAKRTSVNELWENVSETTAMKESFPSQIFNALKESADSGVRCENIMSESLNRLYNAFKYPYL
jgi:hypothetical protein